MLDADVAVVGGGPAGAAAALALAGQARVVLVDRRAEPEDRIGETLPGAARRLLAGLGLDPAAILADGHEPVWARRSVWGAPERAELDSLADPHGPGWRLDRRRFEARLRAEAVAQEVHRQHRDHDRSARQKQPRRCGHRLNVLRFL